MIIVIPPKIRRRRAVSRAVVAVGVICLLTLAGVAVARGSWGPLGGCGGSIAAIIGGSGYLRRTSPRNVARCMHDDAPRMLP